MILLPLQHLLPSPLILTTCHGLCLNLAPQRRIHEHTQQCVLCFLCKLGCSFSTDCPKFSILCSEHPSRFHTLQESFHASTQGHKPPCLVVHKLSLALELVAEFPRTNKILDALIRIPRFGGANVPA